MAGTTNPESFEEIVEWAYSTLPQKIRDLPDFPGIQVVDERLPTYSRGYRREGNGALERNYWDCTAVSLGRNVRTTT
jgi:hypothetical protein